MAKCKMCGKSGLFLKTDKNGFCKECAEKSRLAEESAKKRRAEREQEEKIADSQIARLNKAREQYMAAEDYDSLIAEYEKVFSEENNWNTASHKFSLADYYLKAGRNNDSWALLNQMVIDFPNEISRTRKAMYKQLKAEKNYPEALKMWYLFKFDDFKSYTAWDDSHLSDFTKEAEKLGKKIKIDPEGIGKLTDILGKCIKDKKADESTAIKKFKEWYQNVE